MINGLTEKENNIFQPGGALKINLGCGGSWQVAGWIGIDQKSTSSVWQPSDEFSYIDLDLKKGLPFATNSVDVVFSSHTLEHFTFEESVLLLYEIYRILKIGAPFCVVVPDLDLYLSNFAERNLEFLTTPEIIGGTTRGNLADNFLMNFYSDPKFNNTCHKYAYNFENLSHRLQQVGFSNIERVPFHEFSYYQELRGAEFRSPIKHIEQFSLCVQCRKTSYDPTYRNREDFREAREHARFRESEQDLQQGLSAALVLNNNLTKMLEAQTAHCETLSGQLAASAARAEVLTAKQQRHLKWMVHTRAELKKRRQAIKDLEGKAGRDAELYKELEAELRREAEQHAVRVRELAEANNLSTGALAAALSDLNALKARAKLQLHPHSERQAGSLAAQAPIQYGFANLGGRIFRKLKLSARQLREHRMLKGSGLFSEDWYFERYPEIRSAQADALGHYIAYGAEHGMDPNPLFDTDWYLAQNSQVANACFNPLAQYFRFGAAGGREPHPLFDSSWYETQVLESAKPVGNPLVHYLQHLGLPLDPNPLFDREWYLAQNPDVAQSGMPAFVHYALFGAAEGRDPNPLFKSNWYRSQNPDLEDVCLPLEHYLKFGAREGRDPNPVFDSDWYLKQNPDVAQSGLNPLAHYLKFGAKEGRDPSSTFSIKGYLGRYPDVADSRLDPLVHYLTYGIKEKRDARPLHRRTFLVEEGDLEFHTADPTISKLLAWSRSNAAEIRASPTRFSPSISVLMPTYNTTPRFLREVIDSVKQQVYSNWELCIVDDGSTSADCLAILGDLSNDDPRIRVAFNQVNEGIAKSSQRALEMASGEYVAFVDHDDILTPNALGEVVNLLRQEPMLDMIYTDHAMMSEDGSVTSAGLKPGRSPEFFLSTNYLVHFKVVRRDRIFEVGGFSETLHVAQDIGLTCKLTDGDQKVRHLPKIVYLWRTHAGSVASGTSAKPDIELAALQTYRETLRRRNIEADLVWPEAFRNRRLGVYKLDFPKRSARQVAIIIPALDGSFDPQNSKALLAKTDLQPACEVHIILSDEKMRPANLEGCRVHVAADQNTFNDVVARIEYDVLAFVSPSVYVISPDWLNELVGYLGVSSNIGAVGGKVLDERLRVKAGGYLFLNKLLSICAGESDESDGYWLNGRIASNVEAVSSKLLATPKSVFLEAGGIPFFEFGTAAGAAYGLKLRTAGYRVVYNPWSKVVDFATEPVPSDAMDLLARRFGDSARYDRYYHPFFSRNDPYQIA